jgi:hypothetical protein
MKRLILTALLVSFPAVLALHAQTLKFKQEGEFANLFASPDQFTTVNLSVSRSSSTNTAPTATLNFASVVVASDFSSETFVEITGAIPFNDFTGETTKHLVLDFDTSQLDPSNSFNVTCTIDLATFNQTCNPGPMGTIHLEFAENGLQRTQLLNLDEVVTSGPTTTRIHQRSDNSSANVQGSIFGVPFTSANATVGVNFESTLEVTGNSTDGDHDKDREHDKDKGHDRDHDKNKH